MTRTAVACLLVTCVLAGCKSRSQRGLPVVSRSKVRLIVRDDGCTVQTTGEEPLGQIASHWQVSEGAFAPEPGAEVQAPAVATAPTRRAPIRVQPAVARPQRPALAVPQPRARSKRPPGKRAVKSGQALARDHFIDYPTRIQAAKITLHCPAPLARRVRLTGEDVDRSRPARQRAVGGARLVLGELTLEANRITLRIRPAGEADLQIVARGDVRFVSNVRGRAVREDGLRSLLVTNDRTVPIR